MTDEPCKANTVQRFDHEGCPTDLDDAMFVKIEDYEAERERRLRLEASAAENAGAFKGMRAERDRLLGQLPEGMQDCTIRFVSCEVGHGRLTADNWIDNGCPWCRLGAVEQELTLYKRLPLYQQDIDLSVERDDDADYPTIEMCVACGFPKAFDHDGDESCPVSQIERLRVVEEQRPDIIQQRYEEYAADILACVPYLKEGERPAACIERNRHDASQALGLYAAALTRAEDLEARMREAIKNLDDWVESLKPEIELHDGCSIWDVRNVLAAAFEDEESADEGRRPCHFKAFGVYRCEKEEGHDGDHLWRTHRGDARNLPAADEGYQLSGAKKLCQTYFEIAAEAIGEDEVRRRFRERWGRIVSPAEADEGQKS